MAGFLSSLLPHPSSGASGAIVGALAGFAISTVIKALPGGAFLAPVVNAVVTGAIQSHAAQANGAQPKGFLGNLISRL